VARELKFCGPWKGPDFEASVVFFKGYYCQYFVGGKLSNLLSLTHVAVALGPKYLCALAQQCCMIAHLWCTVDRRYFKVYSCFVFCA